MRKIEIGYITKPQGIKGEVRIKLYSDNYFLFKNLNKIYINNLEYKILNSSNRGTFGVLKLENLNDANEAEKLRNCKVFANYNDLQIGEDEILISDLIGYSVVTNLGTNLGKVTDISNYGAGDIYTVTGAKEILFVNVNDIILQINSDKEEILIDENKLSELSV